MLLGSIQNSVPAMGKFEREFVSLPTVPPGEKELVLLGDDLDKHAHRDHLPHTTISTTITTITTTITTITTTSEVVQILSEEQLHSTEMRYDAMISPFTSTSLYFLFIFNINSISASSITYLFLPLGDVEADYLS